MAYRRTPLMRQRLKDNRARIAHAARQLVAQRGLRGASVSTVAKAAGLSTGALYKYFPSQTDLFIEVLREAVAHEIAILEGIAGGPGTAAAQLQVAVESFVRRAFEGPHLAYAFIAEPADAKVEAARLRARRALGAVFKGIVRKGIASGELPVQDLEVTAACIFGAFTEALVGPLGPGAGRLKNREARVRAISTFCVRAVAGRAPGAPDRHRSRRR